ncbi:FeoA family protein [Amedibacillus sp. YH-ame10]
MLNEIKPQQKVRVCYVHLEEDKRKRMYYLGIYPGCVIEKIQSAPFHDPVLYRVNHIYIVLRNEDTHKIQVEEIV